MGTRADFYVGRGETAEWLGSIAWDGYPSGIPSDILRETDETDFRNMVNAFLNERNDGTLPSMGWPWPWVDSNTTDYAYAFDGGKVWASSFGNPWFDPLLPEPESPDVDAKQVFPNMKDIQNVTWGKRSGIIIVSR